jgi:hypothetical protein
MNTQRFSKLLLVTTLVCALGEPRVALGEGARAQLSTASPCRCGRNGEAQAANMLAPAAPPVALVAISEVDPIGTVIALFAAFERRDPAGWVAAMSPEYRFDSDDPAFLRSHPDGFTRDDELAFVTHLFRGGGRAPDGKPLPRVKQLVAPLGAVVVEMRSLDATRAIAHVERYAFTLTFEDGSQVQLAGSDNVLELALEGNEWLVIAWHERTAAPAAAATAPITDPDGANAIPAQLAIRRLGGLGGNAIAFELALPARGGKLELFDVQGRRVASRSLEGIAPGMRRVELPASGVPAGTYWARVQQSGAVVTTRVIRVH